MTSEVEAGLFTEFWRWLTGLRRRGPCLPRLLLPRGSREHSYVAHRRCVGVRTRPAAFTPSEEWVDLLPRVRTKPNSSHSAALKHVARSAATPGCRGSQAAASQ
jgi:hypothetical protein